MKKKYVLVDGHFVEKVYKLRVGHVLGILLAIVIAALIYVNL